MRRMALLADAQPRVDELLGDGALRLHLDALAEVGCLCTWYTLAAIHGRKAVQRRARRVTCSSCGDACARRVTPHTLPEREGWVEKEGSVVSFRARVYARLRHGVLSYSRGEEERARERVVLQGLGVGVGQCERSLVVGRAGAPPLRLVCENSEERALWVDALRASANWALEDVYVVEGVLAEGAAGSVRSAKRVRTGALVAVKSVQRDDAGGAGCEREVKILEDMRAAAHRHLMHAEDVLEDRTHVHIVQPLMNGGSLRDVLRMSRVLSEDDARPILHDVLSALDALHAHGVVHRDLKPDNVLMHGDESGTHAVIGDFGLSAFVNGDGVVRRTGTICGTPQYAAPETIRGHDVSGAVDVWACGVMLFEMLSGRLPFVSDSYESLFAKIKLAQFNIKQLAHERCSVAARAMVMQLLQAHPDKRISVHDALAHEWFHAAS